MNEAAQSSALLPAARWRLVLLLLIVFAASSWPLSFARSPESWSQLALFRERSVWGALQPFPEYPYYRPLWFFWLSLSDRWGWDGGLAHLAPLLMHLAGAALLWRGLKRFGAEFAFWGSLLAATAPGTAAALSWLAAGNKAFVFAFLALGAMLLLRRPGWRSLFCALSCAALPAIASSENGYLAALLFPFVLLLASPKPLALATLSKAGLLALGIGALAALHLFVLSPQRGAGADDRLAQLLTAWSTRPLASLSSFGHNLGRFFCHDLGIADDAPLLGLLLLLGLAALALLRGFRPLLLALAVFVILNLPASLFPGESSRHHAYLPALGAGLILATLLLRLPGRAFLLPAASIFLVAQGFEAQRPWAEYCAHSARVFASSVEVLPRLPVTTPVLLNVPEEYRAAFFLRFGPAAEVKTWPDLTILSSRSEALLPPDWKAPGTPDSASSALLIEYDGRRLVRSSLAKLAARQRAPLAWFTQKIGAFERPWLAWGEILARKGRLVDDVRGFRAAREAVPSTGQRSVRIEQHGLLPDRPAIYWDCQLEDGPAAWLVLGWTPLSAMPTTENAWLFTLAELPWAFRVRIFEVGEDGQRRKIQLPVHPVYGFLPALFCQPGRQRLHVELELR